MNKYFASLFLVLTTFDMGIKQYIEDTFRKGEERGTGGCGLVIRRVHNKGFCLNTLDKYPAVIKSVSVFVCGTIGVYAYELFRKRGQWIKKLGMTILGAGAFSNTFDRLVRGYVVDYYGFECKNSKLSKITANLADLYVFIGSAIIVALEAAFGKKAEGYNGHTDKKRNR